MPRRRSIVIAVTIYSRPGCHLCDDMKALVRRVAASAETPIAIADVDISTDSDLEARYGLEIPVLIVNGKKAAKYRVTETELTRLLNARHGSGATDRHG
jgi:glutaredoxin